MQEDTAIGNNDLISSILAQRIAETPSDRVPEVEIPDPEGEVVPEQIVKEEKPPQEPDYTEYDEEPAPVQKVTEPENRESNSDMLIETPETDPEETERTLRRRAMTAKWGVRLYDKLQGLFSLFTYDRLNVPQKQFDRRAELNEKVYRGALSEKEREELKTLNELYEAFVKRRGSYSENIYMSEEIRADVQALTEDLLSLSKREISPTYILFLLLLLPVMSNLITAFSHKMQYNAKF